MLCHLNHKIVLGALGFLFLLSCSRTGFDPTKCDGGIDVNGRCYPLECSERRCPNDYVCRDGGCVELTCFDVGCNEDEACVDGVCYPKTCARKNCPGWGEVCVEENCVPGTCFGVDCPSEQRCANGYCYPIDCETRPCLSEEEVCIEGACAQRSCVGCNCPQGQRCAQGYCYPVDCGTEPCAGVLEVCFEGACVYRGCVDVDCPEGQACAGGYCYPLDCADPCGVMEVCKENVCVDRRCVGIWCPPGQQCAGGACWPKDCGQPCGAEEVCVDGACMNMRCVRVQCPGNQKCIEGECVAWDCDVPADCDDNNVCTTESCNNHVCDHTNNDGAPCEDLLFCNGTDTCDNLGNCSVHTGNPCGALSCDEDNKQCVATPVGLGFVSMSAGDLHTCGLTTEGVAYCWGGDTLGQLGNGGITGSSQSPSTVDTSAIPGNKAFVQLTAGYFHTCGLTADGVAYCWGDDSYGELGNGGSAEDLCGGSYLCSQSPSPVDTSTIPGNKAFVQLTGREHHTCGLTVEGVAYCWGQSTQSPSPVDLSGL
jgi:hypothetical protein